MNHINYISAIVAFIPMVYAAGYWIWIFNELTDVEASLLKLKTRYNIFLLWILLSLLAIVVFISMIIATLVSLDNNQPEETKGLCAFCSCYILSISTGFYLYKHGKNYVFLFYNNKMYQYLHRLDDEYITMKSGNKHHKNRVYLLSLKSLDGKYLFTKSKNNFSFKQKWVICTIFGVIGALYTMAFLWTFHLVINEWIVSIISFIVGALITSMIFYAVNKK